MKRFDGHSTEKPACMCGLDLVHDGKDWRCPKHGPMDPQDASDSPDPLGFGEPISVYSRAQAIEDGVLVDLMQHPTPERPELDDLAKLVREAGFNVPLAMTCGAFAATVAPH